MSMETVIGGLQAAIKSLIQAIPSMSGIAVIAETGSEAEDTAINAALESKGLVIVVGYPVRLRKTSDTARRIAANIEFHVGVISNPLVNYQTGKANIKPEVAASRIADALLKAGDGEDGYSLGETPIDIFNDDPPLISYVINAYKKTTL